MRLRLKEDPREWRNFTLLCCAFAVLLSGIAYFGGQLSANHWGIVAGAAAVVAILAVLRPRVFRGWHRFAMTVSFHIGQVMGKVILSAFYLFVLTPLGLILRVAGKELLEMRIDRRRESYWKPARKPGKLEQQY